MSEHRSRSRYRPLGWVGSGGMAVVWRALDTRTGRDVAVKRLHPHLADDPAARERLRREARAMASVEHPGVAPVVDVVDDDGAPAIVMDWIDGTTLADHLVDGPMAESAAIAFAAEVADALAAAHAAGVIHRDLKPGNILLGADGHAHLLDFGIATDRAASAEDLTTDGVVGTLRYLAPERLLGEPATPATDVWGLGVVLYEAITGAPAYSGTTVGDRIEAAARPVARPPGVGDATWAVIRRAADGDPARRYPDGAALAAALRALVPRATVADPDAATTIIPVAMPVVGVEPPSGRVAGSPPAGQSAIQSRVSSRAALGGGIAIALVTAMGLGVIAMDPSRSNGADGPDPSAIPARPAAVPVLAGPTATPTAPPDEDDDEGDGKPGKGKGNGKGKGHGKDKP